MSTRVLGSNTFTTAFNSGLNSSSSVASKQEFADDLNENGEFALTGTNFTTLTPSFEYVEEPTDINNQLFVEINSATSATLKNKGGAENAGKAFKGCFF